MVGQAIYREDDNSGIGNRLLHLTFRWAKEKVFSAIDIGGGHDYKRKFAPRAVNGVRWRIQRLVTPKP